MFLEKRGKMKVELKKKPQGVRLIEGFPGFGLVGTIAAEYLLDHLDVEQIGRIVTNKLPAFVAVHQGKVIEPLGIFYNKEYNLIIQHAVTNIQGHEWEIADSVLDLVKQVKAREIISLEGIGTLGTVGLAPKGKAFYYTSKSETAKKLESLGLKKLKEGIIIGVTGSLLLRASASDMNMIALFAETRAGIPDSRAAASLIEVLDKYIGLRIPIQPLIKKAEEFEDKLQDLFSKVKEAGKEEEQKRAEYIA